ncbi:MAG TPA: hypothetical protein VFR23_24675 [Jiangellaceae bacterium]|nr:hypothetical protein [Jiangellaceae bacterium]
MGNSRARELIWAAFVLLVIGYFLWSVLLKPMIDFGVESRLRSKEIHDAASR